MKIIHISDLHIGKRLNGFSLIPDQEYILDEILKIVIEENADVLLIAGDVYDKSVPPVEAVNLLDKFIFALSNLSTKVMIISGNHDSAERLGFGNRLMQTNGLFIATDIACDNKVVLNDIYGEVHFHLIPFVKPATVKSTLSPEDLEQIEILSYNDAVSHVVNNLEINKNVRNVAVAHQFVTGASLCDSEEIFVGGTENIEADIFSDFDYVALGHIHRPQKISRETCRYSGTPLKYSFSECNHKKSLTIVELSDKNKIHICEKPLVPLRDLVEIKGRYEELVLKSYYSKLNLEDYYHVTLTDEENIFEAMAKLRAVYPNIMQLEYDNMRTKNNAEIEEIEDVKTKSPIEIFEEFYISQNNQDLSCEQKSLLLELISDVWEEK